MANTARNPLICITSINIFHYRAKELRRREGACLHAVYPGLVPNTHIDWFLSRLGRCLSAMNSPQTSWLKPLSHPHPITECPFLSTFNLKTLWFPEQKYSWKCTYLECNQPLAPHMFPLSIIRMISEQLPEPRWAKINKQKNVNKR